MGIVRTFRRMVALRKLEASWGFQEKPKLKTRQGKNRKTLENKFERIWQKLKIERTVVIIWQKKNCTLKLPFKVE